MKKNSLVYLTLAVAVMGLTFIKIDSNKEVAGQIGESIMHGQIGESIMHGQIGESIMHGQKGIRESAREGLNNDLEVEKQVAGQIGESIMHGQIGESIMHGQIGIGQELI
ncbi:MAG: hypothetical protein RSB70_05760 [Clostridium sp.]